jgi:hypothetical protein
VKKAVIKSIFFFHQKGIPSVYTRDAPLQLWYLITTQLPVHGQPATAWTWLVAAAKDRLPKTKGQKLGQSITSRT